MLTRTGRRRLVSILLLPLLAMVSLALAACGDDASEDATATTTATPTAEERESPIEALPPESRLYAFSRGATPYEGDAAQFLAILPFEPMLPESIPGDLELATATIIPSSNPRAKRDLGAQLVLEYRGNSEEDWVQVTQQRQPMADLSAAGLDTVDVAGVEAYVFEFADTDSIQVMWHACEITVAISSPSIAVEEAAAMGASMTEGCEPPADGASPSPTATDEDADET